MRAYFQKMTGTTRGSPPRVNNEEVFWSWVGAFIGISAVAGMSQLLFGPGDLTLLLGSFGSSAVLLFGAPRSPLAQPRNLVGGHILAALVGVSCWQFLYPWPWLAASIAVSSTIALMHVTRTLHPPAGATALIAILGSDKLHALGYKFVLMPVAVGTMILLIVALLVNNIPASRRYPEIWR